MKKATDSEPESYPMTGGDGHFSYYKNSHLQGAALDVSKEIIFNEIAAKLKMEELSPTPTTCFNIADLGCSVGPNTFNAVHNIIEAIRSNYGNHLEFQVLFNDFVSNDFNTLFASLPPSSARHYHVAAVPGSFYTRLFPESSVHVVHSSYSVQWLSRVPESLLDRSSAAWNKGRVHYLGGAPDQVAEAYACQFAKDMEVFLSARSKEMVKGGMMVLLMLGTQDGVPPSRAPWRFIFEFLGFSLADMVKEGKVSEAEVDSFNVPIYVASPGEIRKIVEENGCFSIETIELTRTRSNNNMEMEEQLPSGEALTLNIRSGMESLINNHFGDHIIDQLFDRYLQKTKDFEGMMKSGQTEGAQLLVILKRK